MTLKQIFNDSGMTSYFNFEVIRIITILQNKIFSWIVLFELFNCRKKGQWPIFYNTKRNYKTTNIILKLHRLRAILMSKCQSYCCVWAIKSSRFAHQRYYNVWHLLCLQLFFLFVLFFSVIKTKSIFLRDKLMINKLFTLHLWRQKTFSLYLTISKDPLDKFFSFLA